jgi:hypothetical protein
MINSSQPTSLLRTAVAIGLAAAQVLASHAFAQAPTDAQRNAIKSSCRSDYMAHCASVPPGGAAALQCLQKNVAGLSPPPCQAAVKAVGPAADATRPDVTPAAAESKPAPEPVKPAAEAAEPAAAKPAGAKPVANEPAANKPAANKSAAATPAAAPAARPSEAQIAAIRSACRSDYPALCAGVPTGGAAALQCLEKNKAKLSPSCESAVAAASGGGATPAAAATAPAAASSAAAIAAPAAPVLVLRPMRPLEEARVLNAACGPDARALCGAVQPGGGRIVGCLAANPASLSPACKGMLAEFAAR